MSYKNDDIDSTSNNRSKLIKLSATPTGFGESSDDLSLMEFDSPKPTQHSHSYFECDEQGLYIGVWDTTDMVETAGQYPCDEFMVILEGSVDIKNNKTGVKQKVSAGESFIIPQGYDCQWHQQGYLRKFYVIYEPPTRDIPAQPVIESIIKLPSRITNVNQSQYRHENFSVDVKGASEINRPLSDIASHLFCYLTSGEITIEEANGFITLFKAGDAFIAPANTKFSCHATANTVMQTVEIKPL